MSNLDIQFRITELPILEIGMEFLAEKGLRKQKNGDKYKMLCPFHQEEKPSFFIVPKKNLFVCYGCNKYGGPANLAYFGLRHDPAETLNYLLNKAGIKREEIRLHLELEEDFDVFLDDLLELEEQKYARLY